MSSDQRRLPRLLIGLALLAVWGGAAGAVAAWTDDPLQPGVTPVKKVHLDELRAAIDAMRVTTCGMTAYGWSAAIQNIVPGSTPIQAAFITELQTAAQTLTLNPPNNTFTAASAGGTILAAHLTQLRNAITAATCPPAWQCTGVNSCEQIIRPCPNPANCYGTEAECLANSCANCGSTFYWCTSDAICASGGSPGGSPYYCTNAECVANAAANCPAGCPNSRCDSGETTCNCPQDCGSSCGDGCCNGLEACSSCSGDCGACAPAPFCGDGQCQVGEDFDNCFVDCCIPAGSDTPGPCCTGSQRRADNGRCDTCYSSGQIRTEELGCCGPGGWPPPVPLGQACP